jgi:hypothetical protein
LSHFPLRVHLIAALAFVSAFLTTSVSAFAQITPVGPTFAAVTGSTIYGDVAYDPVNDVYLVVSGRGYGGIRGRFVSAAGTLIGDAFAIPQLPTFNDYYDGVRVAYGGGGFMVAWIGGYPTYGDAARVWCRMLKFGTGGVPQFQTDQLMIVEWYIAVK